MRPVFRHLFFIRFKDGYVGVRLFDTFATCFFGRYPMAVASDSEYERRNLAGMMVRTFRYRAGFSGCSVAW